MKTYRTLIVILSVLVLWLGYLQLSRNKRPAGEQTQEGGQTATEAKWRTNTVELWHTNTVATRYTNTVELWRTNTVVQNFTNEVVKEVAARLSPAAKEAAIAGYKFLNAPMSANNSDALYKASPIAVDIVVNAADKSVVVEDAATIKKNAEAMLQSRNIPVSESSPHRLSISITPSWRSDMPRVAILTFRLDLREKVAVQRQGDVIRSDAIVWSTLGSKFVRTLDLAEELKTAMQEQLEKFASDYLKAKDTQKEMESRIPAVPNDFLAGS
jgi:hypothetical protein